MKRTAGFLSALITVTVAGGVAVSAGTQQKQRASERVSAEFINADSKPAGKATLTQTPNGVLVDVDLSGLEPGWHGFHVHEKGECKAPDFKSAGGHYKPRDHKHGIEVEQGPHAGDMPNVYVGDDGKARFQVFARDLTLRDGNTAILDANGSALMVHAKADDYRSQPSGAAGSRVACAEISN